MTISKYSKNGVIDFVDSITKYSAIETYLSTFVEGIQNFVGWNSILHPSFMQTATSTGRLSSRNPNFQNQPRAKTFPIRKVMKSRFKNGKIMEVDFAQLEFRAAAFLSQDQTAMKEIEDGFDVHSYTARVISDAGEKTSRQEAKAHTFAPLYGATGFGRTPSQATYYKHFTEKYEGIALWHSKLAKEVISTRKITTPSGRQFSFPDVRRNSYGKVSHFTQIKNYPVQSFATADIVPLILINIENELVNLKSCIVNSVHDSIVIDIHPEEIQKVIHVIKIVNSKMINLINSEFALEFNVPLLLEAKIGNNWLDTKDVM